VAQHEARDVTERVMAHGPLEVDGPDRRAAEGGGHVPDDERGVGEIEFEIHLRGSGSRHNDRRYEVHGHGDRQVGRSALGMLDLNLVRRNRGAGGAGESGFRIGSHVQRDVAGIGAQGQYGSGVSTHRHVRITHDIAEIVELRQIHHRGGWCRVHGDVGAAALRHERDGQNLDADQRPVFARRVADEQRERSGLRRYDRRRRCAGATATAASGEYRSDSTGQCKLGHFGNHD
jgi:hypothetical protein